jgi:ribokinase
MGKSIVVVGSSNTDMILKVPRIPKPGETILGKTFSMAAGGKGANQAVAAARAGGDVHFIARLGSDVFGREALDGFHRDGINTDHVSFDDTCSSGVALIFVGEDGENSIGVGSGANANLSKDNIVAAKDVIASADIVLVQLEIPIEAVETAASIARENSVDVILNPAPAMKLSDELLRCVTVLTPNESETELLTGIKVETDDDCLKAAETLRQRGVDTVIITLGSRGAYAVGHEFSGLVKGFAAAPVDTTAAGDVFNGALAVAMAGNMPLEKAVTFANAAGALSVTKLGAQPSAPYLEDILRSIEARKV